MASTEEAVRAPQGTLQELAKRHLWMHFTRMSAYEDVEVPIIVRGRAATSTTSTATVTSTACPRCSA